MQLKSRQPTRRQIQSRQTREKIYKTAIALFNRYGYEAVTIEDITQQTGVSKGAFYVHFSSKDDILLEHFRQTDTYYQNYFDQRDKTGVSAVRQISDFSTYMMDYIQKHMGLEVTRIVYINQLREVLPPKKKFLGDESRPFHTYLQQVMEQGQRDGEFRRDLSPYQLEQLLVRWMRSVIYDWCWGEGSFDLTREFERHLALMLPVLTREASPSMENPG